MAYDPKTSLEDMIGSMFEPLIVFPGGWADTIPDWVRGQVELDRMAQVMEAAKKGRRPEEGTDSEAMVYLYTASFIAPMPPEAVETYLWLGRKVMGKRYPKGMAEELRIPEELGPEQRRFLDDLKRWIWRKRKEGRKGRPRRSEPAPAMAGVHDTDEPLWEAWP